MPAWVIVQGAADHQVLRTVLRDELDDADVRFYEAGGRSAAIGSGRNVLETVNHPVLAIVDADRHDAELLRAELYESLRAASIGAPCEVVVIPPNLEAWVSRVAGRTVRQPDLDEALDDPDLLRRLRDSKVGQELIRAARKILPRVPAGS